MSTAFRVVLEGTQEVPPNDSTASGLGTVIFDSMEVAASYTFQIEGVDYGLVTGGSAQTPEILRRRHLHAFSQSSARSKRARCLRADQPGTGRR